MDEKMIVNFGKEKRRKGGKAREREEREREGGEGEREIKE